MKSTMTSLVLTMVLAVPVVTVWYAVCALLLRPFGMRLPLAIWNKDLIKALRNLSRLQYAISWGIVWFSFGVRPLGMSARYVQVWLRLGETPHESPGEFVANVIWSLVGGIFFGWLMWKYSSPDYDPFSRDDTLSITPKPSADRFQNP
jgi:hypothetical protein